ncbi:MAG TPA: DUF4153 domain-containing protein [Candidatus Alistipes excrementipullorum]|nr:DUF4153 domain-containing protein [Candidatus Alistipes excrementipullorum]
MKKNLYGKLCGVADDLRMSVVRYPVELLIILYAVVGTALAYHGVKCVWYMHGMILAPFVFTLAYILNTLRCPRMAYLLSWVIIIPLSFIGGLEEWIETSQYWISAGILCPLAALISLRRRDNGDFTDAIIAYAASFGVAFVFALTIHLLVMAIFGSTAYIFDLKVPEALWFYETLVAYGIVAPVMFLSLQHRLLGRSFRIGRTVTALVNYVIMPAVLIYTVILYLYAAKITVMWELPKGGIAYMVFAFTIITVAVGAIQYTLERRLYDKYFKYFSFIAIPALILFWTGVVRRIGEYGLSEPRVYLVVCGAIMTLTLALLPSRRAGRYVNVAIISFVLFAAVAWIPFLSAEKLAMDSQCRRIRMAAAEANVLSEDGKLIIGNGSAADTVYRKQHRQIYESLRYIEKDSARIAVFGIRQAEDYRDGLSAVTAGYADAYSVEAYEQTISDSCFYFYASRAAQSGSRACDIAEFKRLYASPAITISADGETMTVEADGLHVELQCNDLLEAMLANAGCTREDITCRGDLEQIESELLEYRTDSILVLFDNISIEKNDEQGLHINNAAATAVLAR